MNNSRIHAITVGNSLIKAQVITDIQSAFCITHGGRFHADDLFAAAIMLLVFSFTEPENETFKVARALTTDDISNANGVTFDIGGGEFDHHQKGGNGYHSNGVPYAAFGLIFRQFGKDVISKVVNSTDTSIINPIFDRLENSIVSTVDACDNGESGVDSRKYHIVSMSEYISARYMSCEITRHNLTNDDYNEQFLFALEEVTTYLVITIKKEFHLIQGDQKVVKLLNNSDDNILVLDDDLPYRNALINHPKGSSIQLVIKPSIRGGFQLCSIPKIGVKTPNDSFKVAFPQEWSGESGHKLQELTHCGSAIFCSNDRRFLVCETKEGALELARNLLQQQNSNTA
jgi:uncharacterized UPF0160 family protein